MFAWLRVCMLSCLVSVYSHLHDSLPTPLPLLFVYIILFIDFWLDYLSPTYSSQIRKHCSLFTQFNRLKGGVTSPNPNVMNITLTGGKKPKWIACVCVELMGNFQLDKAWVIRCVWMEGCRTTELVGVIYISTSHCFCAPLQHTNSLCTEPQEMYWFKYKHSFGNIA